MSKKPAPSENKAMPGPPENKAPAEAEADRVALYHERIASGLSDAEARGTAWPENEQPTPEPTPAPTVKPRTFGFLRPKE